MRVNCNHPLNNLTKSMSDFVRRHIGPSEAEQTQMLSDLGLSSMDELIRQIVPDSILLRGDYKLPDGCSCLLYTSPSPRDRTRSRMPSSA